MSFLKYFSEGGDSEKVAGFLTPTAANLICEVLQFQSDNNFCGSVVEIGTYVGKTFVGLALALREGERAIGIDIFTSGASSTLEPFLENIKKLLPAETAKRVIAIRRDSRGILPEELFKLSGGSARFFHIDGDHTREAVTNDLEIANAVLSAEGCVLIDDFVHDWYPDVTEGVINFLHGATRIVPVAVIPRPDAASLKLGGTKLLCARPQFADLYRDMLIAKMPSSLQRRAHQFVNRSIVTFINK